MRSSPVDLVELPGFARTVQHANEHQHRERVQDGGTSPQVVLHHTSDSGMARFIHVDQGREVEYDTDEWAIVAVVGFDGTIRVREGAGSTAWRPRVQETPRNGSGMVQGRREPFSA